ncbi:MAG TPA: DUF1428 domain-containing protein [Nitrososphaeraceae archaeon]|nr:DUF1428 domain-containing protein [Nitrososphaeraceae archaeon]
MKRQKAHYVDGFVLAVPKRNIDAYRRMARMGGKIWREHGALEFRECVGDDLAVKMGVPFSRIMKKKQNETIIFSWITFKSRTHRDRVNAKVMKDPRLDDMDPKSMPFDVKRMAYGGFKILVDVE